MVLSMLSWRKKFNRWKHPNRWQIKFKSLPFITEYTTTLDGLNKIVSAQMVSDALIANADRFKDMITVDGDSVTSRATSILSSGCYAGDFEIVTVELLLKQPIYIQFTNNNHYNVLIPIQSLD